MNDLPVTFSRSACKHFEPGLAFLLCLHVAICCWSLLYVTESYQDIFNSDKIHLPAALLNVALFAVVAILFTISRFSFGYFLGFYFYTMILGYLWLIEFSQLPYDHSTAKISIFLSGVAFLAPVLFITSPIRQRLVLSVRALDIVLSLILILSAITISAGASYNFRIADPSDIYKFREGLKFPPLLAYALGITANALLPFAFACFVARVNRWRGGIALLLLLLLYPVTLTKMTLFAPFWLVFLTLMSRIVKTRTSVILSLLLPVSCGVALVLLMKAGAIPVPLEAQYFGIVNSRMVATPSIGLEVYNNFFATHDLTHFCQVNVLKRFVDCPYDEPLSIVMSKNYQLGAFNASLFATEGIASVGLIFAPLSALVCGLVIALANRLSSGLPPNFILLSCGVLTQVFLNVPLSTMLLSNGAACLFLLWYVTPRSMFEPGATGSSLSA